MKSFILAFISAASLSAYAVCPLQFLDDSNPINEIHRLNLGETIKVEGLVQGVQDSQVYLCTEQTGGPTEDVFNVPVGSCIMQPLQRSSDAGLIHVVVYCQKP